ncbi:interferon-induced, double-stranded RNA-activated protein kinase-like isoform X2 [Erpetoichthys calabaricus]|uniref:interferon-induced, double-stranded RNA-activated protein kinase-like isoform X2 n=1 Tax=Erpetoichthys calabaricus TaxID=27687 RepID=UPI002233F844|nr:interferon-induced, double-stranded RNA-activated protein kinase-like isoform X2 [Erpetoichthys calabaricus]
MDGTNYISALNEHQQRHNLSLVYKEVSIDGPDHNRMFTYQVILGETSYPKASGKNKKEAKQNAAKVAYEILKKQGSTSDLSVTGTQINLPPTSPTDVNYIGWLNNYGQQHRLDVRTIEKGLPGPAHLPQFSCQFKIGDREFGAATGKNKKEAKKEAAKLAYDELVDESSVQTEDKSKSEIKCSPDSRLSLGSCSSETGNQANGESKSSLEKSEVFSQDDDTSCDANHIGKLNEMCQKNSWVHDFKLIKSGPPHDPEFSCYVTINGKQFSEAKGKTSKDAKQKAAKLALTECCSSPKSSETHSSSLSSSTDSCSKQETESFKTEDNDDFIVFKDSSPSPKASVAISPSLTPVRRSPDECKQRSKIVLAPTFAHGNEAIHPKTNLQEKNTFNEGPKSSIVPELSGFDQLSHLDKGGFGYVWKARKILENKFYAVKRVKYNDKAKREVEALAHLDHKNIVRYFTSWVSKEFPSNFPETSTSSSSSSSSDPKTKKKYLYIQMKLYEKGNLETWMDKNKRSKIQAMHMFAQIVEGVEHIHSSNLIHRDLKPKNIFIGDDDTVKIGDFGLACTTSSDDDNALIERTKRTGTVSYMSPEQKNLSNYGNEVDIFSLGLIFFELLWPVTTKTEMSKIWPDVREGHFPEPFCNEHGQERLLIRAMLSEDPKNRPTAKHLSNRMGKMIENNSHSSNTV